MLKYFISLCICLISGILNAQSSNPYLALNYDKVIAYDYSPGSGEDVNIINKKGQLSKAIKKQVTVDKITLESFNKRVGLISSYGGGVSACFVPHLGLVYYLKGKVVAHVSICMLCNRLHSSLPLPAQRPKKSNGVIYDGMSDEFGRFIKGILAKYKFTIHK